MQQQQKLGIAFLLVLFGLLCSNAIATSLFYGEVVVVFTGFGATEDEATGSFQLNAAPSLSGVDYQTDGYSPTGTLTPDASTYFRLNFTISHSATMADLDNVTIWMFDDSIYGATYNTSAANGFNLTEFTWIQSTSTYSVSDQGALTGWTVDNDTSDHPATTDTSFTFSMRFRLSKACRYCTDFNASVHVYDDDEEADYASESGLVTVNQNFEITYSASTFSWGSAVLENSNNNTHGALTLTVLSNDQWQISINATDFNATGESDVDIEAQNILAWDEDGSNGDTSQWIRNTQAACLGSWDNQISMTHNETGFQRNCYFFLSPGTYFAYGKQWNTTVTVYAEANT